VILASGMRAFHETIDPDEPRHPLVERPGTPGTP
jgi:hypothetical protein